MSAFLGKIHYWLYDKIKLHEQLLLSIATLAEKNGFHTEALVKESHDVYGLPVTGQLENEIAHDNIHGWLQERIASVESRIAFVVTELFLQNAVKKEELAELFYHNGAEIMSSIEVADQSPQGLFQLVYDYMLEGMPCDRVNEVVENTETKIVWNTTTDLHQGFWDAVCGDVQIWHTLRTAWIQGFLSTSGTGYQYTRTESGVNTIGRM